jgi:hypothetical protein
VDHYINASFYAGMKFNFQNYFGEAGDPDDSFDRGWARERPASIGQHPGYLALPDSTTKGFSIAPSTYSKWVDSKERPTTDIRASAMCRFPWDRAALLHAGGVAEENAQKRRLARFSSVPGRTYHLFATHPLPASPHVWSTHDQHWLTMIL